MKYPVLNIALVAYMLIIGKLGRDYRICNYSDIFISLGAMSNKEQKKRNLD